jgi:3-methyladenine DNA glycosylase AlkD|tara:strand:+ start:1154 stop:1897 length:744 start_codon:yes stop_codon:yes gene_type:complete
MEIKDKELHQITSTAMLNQLKKELKQVADPARARHESRYFKTGKGEYGEGDIFLGIKTAYKRKLAKKYSQLSLKDVEYLISSKFHDYRFIALVILINKYQKGDKQEKKQIFNFYLKNTQHINNWDLVDISAPNIIGDYLLDKDRKILYKLVKSKSLWERRISVLATFRFIKENQFKDALKISEILLNDKHDLIHKAVGWMLRQVGKKDQMEEEKFLLKHYQKMPRIMLRYAIERFKENKRQFYLKKT